jgi:hypothetical protein
MKADIWYSLIQDAVGYRCGYGYGYEYELDIDHDIEEACSQCRKRKKFLTKIVDAILWRR